MQILFVCTGNTSRSPMAESLFNARRPDGVRAVSAGLTACGGKPMTENARAILAEIGAETSHISVPISEEAVRQSDFVYGMTKEHAAALRSRFPLFSDKIFCFPVSVGDPYGCDLTVYRRCRDRISDGIELILREVCHA